MIDTRREGTRLLNITWLTKHKDTSWHEHKTQRYLAPLVSMDTDKASWQVNDKRRDRRQVVIEEDQDGDPWSSNESLSTDMRWVWTTAWTVSKVRTLVQLLLVISKQGT